MEALHAQNSVFQKQADILNNNQQQLNYMMKRDMKREQRKLKTEIMKDS